jgi:hypothetical protein
MVSDQQAENQARAERTARYVSRFGHQRVDTRAMELRWRRDAAPREASDPDRTMPERRQPRRLTP